MARRSKEDIERDAKMCDTVKAALAKLITAQWEEMRQARGPIDIRVEIDVEKNEATIGYGFVKQMSGKASFVMDDGQAGLGLQSGPGTGATGTSATT